jgi:hypothetical protein
MQLQMHFTSESVGYAMLGLSLVCAMGVFGRFVYVWRQVSVAGLYGVPRCTCLAKGTCRVCTTMRFLEMSSQSLQI